MDKEVISQKIAEAIVAQMKRDKRFIQQFAEVLERRSDKDTAILGIMHGILQDPGLKKELVRRFEEATRRRIEKRPKKSFMDRVKEALK